MNNVIYILLCSLLFSCSTNTVHLNTRYLSENNIEVIESALKEKNFTVKTNNLPFPRGIQQSSIIYSPLTKNENVVEEIVSILSQIGFDISAIDPIESGNHWYRRSNFGLFIVPEGVKVNNQIARQDLALEYKAKDCGSSIQLKLNIDGTYEFTPLELPNNNANHLKGHWRITGYPYIELQSIDKTTWFFFIINQTVMSDKVSNINIISLKPADIYNKIPNCEFVHGTRI